MTSRLLGAAIAALMLVIGINPVQADITDDLITPEIILDGMTHFEADQGIEDYSVMITETNRWEGTSEVVTSALELMFLAPNLKLTLMNSEPRTFSYDASFQMFLSKMELEKGDDAVVRGVDCFQIIATPIEFGYKKYTKTYFVSKDDFRKMKLESYRSEQGYGLMKFVQDFEYRDVHDGDNVWILTDRSEVIATDIQGERVMHQVNDFHAYEFGFDWTVKDFEKILEDYKTFYSEGN